MEYPNELIMTGSRNAVAVKAIKQRLNDLGIAQLDVTNGTFGPSTFSAVWRFQDNNQLKPDGVVGELTWERLFTVSVIQPVDATSLLPRVAQWLDTQLFVRELTGHNDGREIAEYQKITGIPAGSPYCQALLYTAFFKMSADLQMKNPMPKTGSVLEHRRLIKTGKYRAVVLPAKQAKPNDIFIMDFGSNGHTGWIEEAKGDRVWTAEGNTNNDGSRDGNGNYERVRLIRTLDCVIRYQV